MGAGATAWHVYLVRCADGSLYTGIATDVGRRLDEHANGVGAKYLRGRGPLELVYAQRVGERGLAQRVEHALKRIPRSEKEALVRSSPSRAALLRTLAEGPE